MTKSVFISSTSKDLQAHREVVRDTILRLESLPIDMIYFGAREGEPVNLQYYLELVPNDPQVSAVS